MRLIPYDDLRPEKGIVYTREHIARLVKREKFPAPVPLSSKRIAWLEAEVDAWIAQLAAQRDAKVAA